jgi:hypothetical protein
VDPKHPYYEWAAKPEAGCNGKAPAAYHKEKSEYELGWFGKYDDSKTEAERSEKFLARHDGVGGESSQERTKERVYAEIAALKEERAARARRARGSSQDVAAAVFAVAPMVGGGQTSSQNSPPLTLCYAEAEDPPWASEEDPEDPDAGKAIIAGVAAIGATSVVLGVSAKLAAGATIAGIAWAADKNRSFEDVSKSVGKLALSAGEPLLEKAGPKLLEAAGGAVNQVQSKSTSVPSTSSNDPE